MRRIAILLIFAMLFTPNLAIADEAIKPVSDTPIVIDKGTEVLLKVIDKLKSSELSKGQIIQFLVEKAVKDKEGHVLIEDDAKAYGTVAQATKAGFFGTSGKLAISVDKVESFNGKDIPLTGSKGDEGSSSTGAVVAGVLFVSVLSAFFRGSNAVIPAGTIMRAYVEKTTVLSGDVIEDKTLQGFTGTSEVDKKLNEYLKKSEEDKQ